MLLTNFKNKPDSTHATPKIKARLLPRCKPEGLLLTRRSVDATPSGGDVLLINKNNGIQLIFDGWYCEKEDNETDSQYAKRSGIYAKDYISGYKNEHVFTDTFIFDIVFGRKIYLELFSFEKYRKI